MGWAQVAGAQAGIVTRAQLLADGLSGDQVDHLLASGAVVGQTNAVFLVRGAPLTLEAREWAAVLATDGLLAFDSASYRWHMAEAAPERVHVVIPHSRRVHIPLGVRLYRVPVPGWAAGTLDGLPVTGRSWTALDVLGRMRGDAAYRFADRALQRGWFTAAELRRRLAAYPGRTGNRMLRLVASQCGDGAAAESERALHRILRGAKFTGWEPNVPVVVDGQVVAVLDVAFAEAKLAIEVDGWAFHSDVDQFQRDRHRQNALHALGWTVLRFTWADLITRRSYVIATIRAQLRDRGVFAAG